MLRNRSKKNCRLNALLSHSTLAALLAASPALAGPDDVPMRWDDVAPHVHNEMHDEVPERAQAEAQADESAVPTPLEVEPSRPEVLMKPSPLPKESYTIDAPVSVSVSETAAPNFAGIGTRTQSETGFGYQVWQGISEWRTTNWLQAMPQGFRSTAVRSWLANLFLTEAAPPDEDAGMEWIDTRVKALIRIGAWNEALALLERVPEAQMINRLWTQKTRILLAQRRHAEACDTISTAQADANYKEYWALPTILCHALLERTSEAELALSLRQENDDPTPDWFATLIDSFTYDSRLSELPDLTPLQRSMLYTGGSQVFPAEWPSAEQEAALPLMAKYRLSQSGKTPPARRIRWLEHVIARGAGDEETLAAAYRSIEFSEKELEGALKDYDLYTSFTDRALLWQRLESTRRAKEKAELSRALLHAYRADGLQETAARMLAKPLGDIAVSLRKSSPYTDLTLDATRILLPTSQHKAGKLWLRLLDRQRGDSVQSYMLHEIVRFAEEGAPTSPTAGRLPPAPITNATPDFTRQQLLRFYRVLGLFGYSAPKETMDALAAQPVTEDAICIEPDAQFLGAMIDQAQDEDVSEAAILAALAIGQDNLWRVCDSTLEEVISTLMAIGQREAARGLALESLLTLTPEPLSFTPPPANEANTPKKKREAS